MNGEDALKAEDFLETIRPLISAHREADRQARVAHLEAFTMLGLIKAAINGVVKPIDDPAPPSSATMNNRSMNLPQPDSFSAPMK